MDDFVWIEHPETGGKARIPAAALEGWQVRGWREGAAPPAVDPATAEREHIEAAQTRSNRKPTTRE